MAFGVRAQMGEGVGPSLRTAQFEGSSLQPYSASRDASHAATAATRSGLPGLRRPLLGVRRMLALATLVMALVVGVSQPALADELTEGALTLTQDVWSVGVITEYSDSMPEDVAGSDYAAGTNAPEDAGKYGSDALADRGDPDTSGPSTSGGQASDNEAATTTGAEQSDSAPDGEDSSAISKVIASTMLDDSTNGDEGNAPATATEGSKAESGTGATTASDTASYSPDTVIVGVVPGTTSEQLSAYISAARAQGVSVSAQGVTQADLDFGVLCLTVVDGMRPDEVISKITQVKGIVSAQRNYIYSTVGSTWEATFAEGEEPSYADVLAALGQELGSNAFTKVNDKLTNDNWVADAVNAWDAWDLVKTQGSVAVAVIDTGVDLTHDDLVDRIVASYNSYDASLSASDENGHGTHVAGIIAGTANNGFGLAGLSYNANLVAIKASAPNVNSFETASVVRAYAWLLSEYAPGETVAQHYNVRVINMSVGSLDDTHSANDYDDEIVAAILRARQAGILTVVAAGNKTSSADPYLNYPGDSDVCLSVMNLMKKSNGTYDLSDTSNYNLSGTTYKDVCAPGTTIYSTYRGRDAEGKSLYVIMGGTSMAAPQVAGLAALMFAANPQLTPELAMSIIEATCTDLGDEGWDERFGYGLVDAAAAVRMASDLALEGPSVIGVGSKGVYAISGSANSADASGWSWSTTTADAFSGGSALASADGSGSASTTGSVTGLSAGSVIVRAVCTAVNGAEIAVMRVVEVITAVVEGLSELVCGQTAGYTVVDANDPTVDLTDLEWAWLVDEGNGIAYVDAEGQVRTYGTGTVTVRAICKTNPWLSFTKQISVSAA